MNNMFSAVEDLRKAAAAITDAANKLSTVLEQEKPETEQATVKVNEVISIEKVRTVLAEKSREGFTVQIHELLKKYGAGKLSEIDPANYRALLEDAEGLANAT